MIDLVPRLFMLIDFSGEILFWSEGGEEVFGRSADEMAGRPVWELYPDRGEQDFMKEREAIERGETVSMELRAVRAGGSEIWVDVKRRLFETEDGRQFILGSASDVTGQVKLRREHSRNETRMRTILENTVEGIITIDAEGRIRDFNRAAERMFGYEEEEVRGENVKMLMPQPYRREHDGYIRRYLETGEEKIIGIGREVRGRRRDGTVFPMELSVSEIQFEDEMLFIGQVKDISDRRELENEILQVSEQERQAIGRDLHDGLGQMLTGIKMISHNLARKLKANGLPGSGEVEEISEMIHEADRQAKALTQGLVGTELGAEGFREVLSRLSDRVKKMFDIDCEVVLDEDIAVDHEIMNTHFYRIIQEAINNAVKHGRASEVWVSLKKKDDFVALEIRDNGIGFEESRKEGKDEGIGMSTMRYRSHVLGGHLETGKTSEGRTFVRCTIPETEFQRFVNREHPS